MNLMLGSVTVGLLLALLSLGTFLSFRVLRSLDLTTDGSFTTGAAVSGALLLHGWPASLSCVAGLVAGASCGAVTGLIHTRWRIDLILAGILVTTGLYSIDLWVMGSGNLSLAARPTLFDEVARLNEAWPRDGAALVLLLALAVGVALALGAFSATDLGLALRATGTSPRMASAMAIDTGLATTIGLALANGLIGLAGALFAQYQGFANVQMGVGMIVTGLASLILGEALLRPRTIWWRIIAAVVGAVAFRLLIAMALAAGMDPAALKLVTALFVLLALVLPRVLLRFFHAPRSANG